MEKSSKKQIIETKADQDIAIEIYTDPLCCWSWAFQPQLELLQHHLAGRASWHYRMGGLLPSWDNFNDEVNHVTRPAQWGPVWMHAGAIANKPIYHQLWVLDPPASSYPSCIAVKCAQLQADSLGEIYLGLLRHACMTDGKNISRQDVLFGQADLLAAVNSQFDAARFREDYLNDNGINAFRLDLDLVRKYQINRFPTLIVKASSPKAIIISGNRSYIEVLKAMQHIIPDIMVPEI